MTVFATRTAKIAGPGYRLIAWILLFAFTLQSFITQTHLHTAIDRAGSAAIVKTLAPSHSKTPAKDDPSDCPYCQAIVHAGTFSVLSAPVLILPSYVAVIVHPLVHAVAADTTSFRPWHSRAPPRP